jgi:hypothetical protein
MPEIKYIYAIIIAVFHLRLNIYIKLTTVKVSKHVIECCCNFSE